MAGAWIAPYSLLAAITETSTVASVTAPSTRSGSSSPEGSGSTRTISEPGAAASRVLPDGGVLGAREDDAARARRGAAQSEGVGLRAPGREEDEAAGTEDEPRDRVPGFLDDPARRLSRGVDGRGVAEGLLGLADRRAGARVEGGRRVVVEVDHFFERLGDHPKLSPGFAPKKFSGGNTRVETGS